MRAFQLFVGLLFCFSTSQLNAAAKEPVKLPHDKVAIVTDQVLKLVVDARPYFDKDPKRFYGEVRTMFEPLVDFDTFTRGVMGSYGTKDYYQSLKTQAEKDAFKKNYKRFVDTFKEGLINTYGKGLMAFNGQKTEIIPPTADDKKNIERGRPVEVIQTVQGKDEKYKIVYKMKKDKKSGEWLLQNVTIEAINVGLLYRNQFSDAMDKYHDFGKVVDNWTVTPQNVNVAKEDTKK